MTAVGLRMDDQQHHLITDPLPEAPPTEPPEPAGELKPVSESERILALDVLRGFAIFGIFMVNIAFFSMPLFVAMDMGPLADAAPPDQIAWIVTKAFFEIKFITLFSLLFGVGLIVQMKRIEARGGHFVSIYLRRVVALAVIGLVHGLLIWYGDILFMYAAVGVAILACRNLPVKTLLLLSALSLLIGGVMYGGCVGVAAWGEAEQQRATAAQAAAVDRQEQEQPEEVADQAEVEQEAEADSASAAGDDPWQRFQDAIRRSGYNPDHPAWAEAETIAYREGPFLAAFIMRAFSYAGHIFFAGLLSGFIPRVLALFLFGAALMKLNFFDADKRRWHVRLLLFGLIVGLPLELAAALTAPLSGWQMTGLWLAGEVMHYFSSVALTLGYLGATCLIVHSGAMQWITSALAAVGRMALTNYIGQSVIATFIMYWWGLGLFGEFSRAQQIGLVVLIFLGQIVFSVLWLRFFTMGPLEALWRTATYGRWPAMWR